MKTQLGSTKDPFTRGLLWCPVKRFSLPVSNTVNGSSVFKQTRPSVGVNWVGCGTCYTKTEGTELGGIELYSVPAIFLSGGEGGDVDHFRGHPDVMPATAL